MTPTVALPSLDARRYAETFGVFLEHSREYALMVDELVRVIHAHLPSGFRLLDIGAGTGCLIRSLAERPEVTLAGRRPTSPIPVMWRLCALCWPRYPYRPGCTRKALARPPGSRAVLTWCCSRTVSIGCQTGPEPRSRGRVVGAGRRRHRPAAGPYGVHALFNLFQDHYRRLPPMLQNNRLSSHELVAGLRARAWSPKSAC